jgi:hypothetical protein
MPGASRAFPWDQQPLVHHNRRQLCPMVLKSMGLVISEPQEPSLT